MPAVAIRAAMQTPIILSYPHAMINSGIEAMTARFDIVFIGLVLLSVKESTPYEQTKSDCCRYERSPNTVFAIPWLAVLISAT